MINCIHVGSIHTTYGIWNIIKAIEDNPNEILSLYTITSQEGDRKNYIWVALFREKGTIGHFTALINMWGTSYGASAGGTGMAGFCEMMSLSENQGIEIIDFDLDNLNEESQKILRSASNFPQCYEILEEMIVDTFDSVLPLNNSYPINEHWAERVRRLKNH